MMKVLLLVARTSRVIDTMQTKYKNATRFSSIAAAADYVRQQKVSHLILHIKNLDVDMAKYKEFFYCGAQSLELNFEDSLPRDIYPPSFYVMPFDYRFFADRNSYKFNPLKPWPNSVERLYLQSGEARIKIEYHPFFNGSTYFNGNLVSVSINGTPMAGKILPLALRKGRSTQQQKDRQLSGDQGRVEDEECGHNGSIFSESLTKNKDARKGAKGAILTWILCARKIYRYLGREIRTMIAKQVWETRKEFCWWRHFKSISIEMAATGLLTALIEHKQEITSEELTYDSKSGKDAPCETLFNANGVAAMLVAFKCTALSVKNMSLISKKDQTVDLVCPLVVSVSLTNCSGKFVEEFVNTCFSKKKVFPKIKRLSFVGCKLTSPFLKDVKRTVKIALSRFRLCQVIYTECE